MRIWPYKNNQKNRQKVVTIKIQSERKTTVRNTEIWGGRGIEGDREL